MFKLFLALHEMIPCLLIHDLDCCLAVKRKREDDTELNTSKRLGVEQMHVDGYSSEIKNGVQRVKVTNRDESFNINFDNIPMIMAQLSAAYVAGGGSRGVHDLVRQLINHIHDYPLWTTPEEGDEEVGPSVAHRATLPRVKRNGSEFVAEHVNVPRTLLCQIKSAQNDADLDFNSVNISFNDVSHYLAE